jgi:polysaccharide export outer membrane protein
MFDHWELAGRRRLAEPQAARSGLYEWLIRFWAIVLICLLGSSPAVSQDYEYSLGTGDQLRVTVFGHVDLSGDFEVDSAGRISLPLVGDLLVVNRSLDNVEQLIVSALKPDYLKNPQVSVEIISYRPFYIIGEIANPGSYPYVGGMRVINAVAMAGGFTYRAVKDDLLITRAKGRGKQERVGQGTSVLPGDVIEVSERFF